MRASVIWICLVFMLIPGAQSQEQPVVSNKYYALGAGGAIPFGGHWGDKETGFKPSTCYIATVGKKVDELLSYGVETSFSSGHENRKLKAMEVRVFSLTPFLRTSYQRGLDTFYGLLGAGIYHWSQPAFSSGGVKFGSDSGSSLGVNVGGGVVTKFTGPIKIGLDLRLHHVFSFRGENVDTDVANFFTPSISFYYGF